MRWLTGSTVPAPARRRSAPHSRPSSVLSSRRHVERRAHVLGEHAAERHRRSRPTRPRRRQRRDRAEQPRQRLVERAAAAGVGRVSDGGRGPVLIARRRLSSRKSPTRIGVVQVEQRQPRSARGSRSGLSVAIATTKGSFGYCAGLPARGAPDLDLQQVGVLEAFDQHPVARATSSAISWCTVGSARPLEFADLRQPPVRGDHHLEGAGLAMAPRVLARMVDVELVVRMLDHRDALAGAAERARSAARPAWSCPSPSSRRSRSTFMRDPACAAM